MAFTLRCSAFEDGKEIPSEYTCEGIDVSPELTWSGAPEGTKTFALVVDDPDAPDPQRHVFAGCIGCSTTCQPIRRGCRKT